MNAKVRAYLEVLAKEEPTLKVATMEQPTHAVVLIAERRADDPAHREYGPRRRPNADRIRERGRAAAVVSPARPRPPVPKTTLGVAAWVPLRCTLRSRPFPR